MLSFTNLRILNLCSILFCVFLIQSCDSDDVELPSVTNCDEPGVYNMKFNSSRPIFDKMETRGVYQKEWTNTDTLFIFFNYNSVGKGIYSSLSKQWKVTFIGDAPNSSGFCHVCFVDGGDYSTYSYSSSFGVDLIPENVVYSDMAAKYEFVNNELFLIANLEPQTSRIRFVHSSPTTIRVKGFDTASYFDYSGLNWKDYKAELPITILINKPDDNGMYTSNYIYGSNTIERAEYDIIPSISLIDVSNPSIYYTRPNSTTNYFMTKGKSGYMRIPSSSNHEGWEVCDNYIKTLATNIDCGGTNKEFSYDVGKAFGYGIRCDADIVKISNITTGIRITTTSSTHSWDHEYYHWSLYTKNTPFKGSISFDIGRGESIWTNDDLNADWTIHFEHWYGDAISKAQFSNIKLYYFSY